MPTREERDPTITRGDASTASPSAPRIERSRGPTPSGHAELVRLIQRFAGLRVLVWADLVVDEFVITGEPRVSREAPVLILKYKHRRFVPGGGANAAANVAALGGVPLVLGEVGDDAAGERLVALLREAGCDTTGVFVRRGFRTPRKTRFLAGDKHVALQQVVRVDRIEPFEHDDALWEEVSDAARRLSEKASGVLLSDYGIGFVEPDNVSRTLPTLPSRERLKVVLDSRHRLFDFEGVDVATPSEPEIEEALRRPLDQSETLERAGREALQRLKSRALILTRGSQGMMVFEQGEGTESVPAFGSGSVADVTGAGDTVLAALSLALAAGGTVAQAARIANAAAGIAVTKMGTATVSASELVEHLERTI